MKQVEARCLPYTGDEPFVYLCFSPGDAGRVWPLLGRLYARGCRVWYPVGPEETAAQRERRDRRMREAALLVLYQTRRAREDQAVKSAVLVCQAKGIPIVSIDTDGEESMLSMGLDARAVHIRERGVDAVERALLHGSGFTQDLIGPPNPAGRARLLPAALGIFAAALLLMGAMLLYRRLCPRYADGGPLPGDTVSFSDPALTRAVREAVGGGALTETALETVTALRLEEIPENADELSRLPNLTRIWIDQAAAGGAQGLLERYEIVLTGGGQ